MGLKSVRTAEGKAHKRVKQTWNEIRADLSVKELFRGTAGTVVLP